jgi:hypothetical protein
MAQQRYDANQNGPNSGVIQVGSDQIIDDWTPGEPPPRGAPQRAVDFARSEAQQVQSYARVHPGRMLAGAALVALAGFLLGRLLR